MLLIECADGPEPALSLPKEPALSEVEGSRDVRDPGEEGPFTLGEPSAPEASVSVPSMNRCSPEYLPGLESRETWGTRLRNRMLNAYSPMDRITAQVRSQLMARVRNKHTSAELIVRSIVHRMGFRFRLRAKDLPCRPDLVFPSRKKVIFVHGCFWHGHSCRRGKAPSYGSPERMRISRTGSMSLGQASAFPFRLARSE